MDAAKIMPKEQQQQGPKRMTGVGYGVGPGDGGGGGEGRITKERLSQRVRVRRRGRPGARKRRGAGLVVMELAGGVRETCWLGRVDWPLGRGPGQEDGCVAPAANG